MYLIQMRFPLPAGRTPKEWGGIHKDAGGQQETEAAANEKMAEMQAKYPSMEYRVVAA